MIQTRTIGTKVKLFPNYSDQSLPLYDDRSVGVRWAEQTRRLFAPISLSLSEEEEEEEEDDDDAHDDVLRQGRDLFFDWWRTHSWPSYALSLLACFLFSLFYQYLEDRRLRFNSAADRLSHPLLSKIGHPRLPQRLASAALIGFNAAIG